MAGNDDLLNPEDIEALLRDANRGPSPPPAASTPQEAPAAVPQATGVETSTAASPSPEKLLDQAEANLAAAVAPNVTPHVDRGVPAELGEITPFEMDSFDGSAEDESDLASLKTLQDVELDVRIELGRAELLIEEVLKLKQGSVVPLDKLAGDPVDILVNGKLIARGEVLVLNDNFCVRVAEILTPDY